MTLSIHGIEAQCVSGEDNRLTDVTLFDAVRNGDKEAYRKLFRRFAAEIVAVCHRILDDRDEAEDVATEVFWEMWRRSDRYDPARATPRSYLVMMARNRQDSHSKRPEQTAVFAADRARGKRSMNCRECLEQLDEYSVAVDQASHAKVAAHLRECGPCRERLVEITEAWSLLSAALDPIEPSESVESKLMAQVDDKRLVRKAQHPLVGRARLYVPYLVAASVLLIATAGLYFTRYRTPDISAVKQIDKQLRRLEEIQDRFGNPDIIYVALQDVNRQSTAACAIFDPIASQLHFFAMELQPPTKSTCYKLWLLRDNDVVASAVLDVNGEQVASAVVDLESGVEIVEALITLESDPQAESPQGGVCLRTTIDFVGMDTNQ